MYQRVGSFLMSQRLTAVYTSSNPLGGRIGLLVTGRSRRDLHVFERLIAPRVPAEALAASEQLEVRAG